jgi:hypothetical protein
LFPDYTKLENGAAGKFPMGLIDDDFDWAGKEAGTISCFAGSRRRINYPPYLYCGRFGIFF